VESSPALRRSREATGPPRLTKCVNFAVQPERGRSDLIGLFIRFSIQREPETGFSRPREEVGGSLVGVKDGIRSLALAF